MFLPFRLVDARFLRNAPVSYFSPLSRFISVHEYVHFSRARASRLAANLLALPRNAPVTRCLRMQNKANLEGTAQPATRKMRRCSDGRSLSTDVDIRLFLTIDDTVYFCRQSGSLYCSLCLRFSRSLIHAILGGKTCNKNNASSVECYLEKKSKQLTEAEAITLQLAIV